MSPPLAWEDLRRRTGDLRGVADLQLLRSENGPGQGQRLLIGRSAVGLGFEVAVDRGFDLAGLTWRGINLGWRGLAGRPSVHAAPDAEDGLALLRAFDGFLVTGGLDHHGPPARGPADHFGYDHRRSVHYPLHGRIASAPATLIGYGLDESVDAVLWCEAEIRQAALFAEHLVLRRRIEVGIWSARLRIADTVVNRGFEPVPHAMLYHFNLGYPLLDQGAELTGDLGDLERQIPAPVDGAREWVDYLTPGPAAPVWAGLTNRTLDVALRIGFDPAQLPGLALWRCWRSGLYAVGLEPCTLVNKDTRSPGNHLLQPGETRSYRLTVEIAGANGAG